MSYPTIKTTEELRSFMSTVKTAMGKEGGVTDENLFWFVCIYNAKLILDSYTTKDIGAMLQGGVDPTNKLDDVQQFIDTFYEDVDSEDVDYAQLQSLYIIREVADFYSAHDKSADVDAKIQTLEEQLGM